MTAFCRVVRLVALLTTAVMPPAFGAAVPGHEVAGRSIATRLADAHFAEPLVATGPTTPAEDKALLRAVTTYEHPRLGTGDFSSLTRFLKHLFLCGPMALKRLLLAQRASFDDVHFLDRYRAGPKGTSLAEVAALAKQAKVLLEPVFRRLGDPVPVPSIVHWRVGHFAAIVGEANGLFQIEDPVFGHQALWMTRAAVAAEGSGYFLTPRAKMLAARWRRVGGEEAGRVWGTGQTSAFEKGNFGPNANQTCGSTGMCGYNISEMAVSLKLTDHPVGYTPPKGPSAKVTITYNQREDSQPANFNYFNIGPKWTFNWHVQDDPTKAGSMVARYLPGGGANFYAGYSRRTQAFAPQEDDASTLVLMQKDPVIYDRFLADGSVEVYAQDIKSRRRSRRTGAET